MKTEIERRVQRGAQVLDHFYPDWEFRVRPENILSIKDPGCCTMKEVAGSYVLGSIACFGTPFTNELYDAGFCTGSDHIGGPEDLALVDAWHALIAERRAAANVAPNLETVDAR